MAFFYDESQVLSLELVLGRTPAALFAIGTSVGMLSTSRFDLTVFRFPSSTSS